MIVYFRIDRWQLLSGVVVEVMVLSRFILLLKDGRDYVRWFYTAMESLYLLRGNMDILPSVFSGLFFAVMHSLSEGLGS